MVRVRYPYYSDTNTVMILWAINAQRERAAADRSGAEKVGCCDKIKEILYEVYETELLSGSKRDAWFVDNLSLLIEKRLVRLTTDTCKLTDKGMDFLAMNISKLPQPERHLTLEVRQIVVDGKGSSNAGNGSAHPDGSEDGAVDRSGEEERSGSGSPRRSKRRRSS